MQNSFVKITTLRTEYRRTDTGIDEVLVLPKVARMLEEVQKRVEPYELLIVEGYRPFAYQEKYFLQELHAEWQSNPALPLDQLIENTHQRVALPSLAGHPSGGAVDLTLCENGKEVDMGGGIADFSTPKLLPTFSPLATPPQAKCRLLLHDAMVAEGFAPFYGEWWHFSYGDYDWKQFYNN